MAMPYTCAIKNRALLALAVVVCVVGISAGLYARLQGLGDRPLADDEYYFISSVNRILEHGIPKFPSGDYYNRGLLLQYITAASARVLGSTEFAYRLPGVLFSVASVILLYVYSRKWLGHTLAGAVALTLLVSSWHIEFARFARMYAAFQCMTLLFLIAAEKAFVQRNWHLRYWPHICAIGALLTHDLGILFMPLLWLPFLLDRPSGYFPSHRHLFSFCSVTVFTVLAGLLFFQLDPADFGVVDRFPDNYVFPDLQGPLYVPVFPFWSISNNPVSNLVFLCGLLAIAGIIACLVRYKWQNVQPTDVMLILLLISTALHALLISFACAVVLLCRYDIHRYHQHPKRYSILLCLALLIATGWLTYALTRREWVTLVDGGGFYLLWALRRTFFGWPDLYQPFYFPWSQELPVLGLFIIGALTYQIATKLKNSWSLMLNNPTCIVVYIVFCAGILRSHFLSTRYTFFMYPVLLCVMALSIKEITERVACRTGVGPLKSLPIISAVVYIAFFTVSEDFNPRHIANIDTADVGFRMAAYERFGRTWYARPDYATPANFLNSLALPVAGATRLVVVESPPVSYYLKREHAVYYDRRGLQFANLSRQRGTVDLMSNNRLLSTIEELQEYTAGVRTVWVVRRSRPEEQQPFALQKVWNSRLEDVSRVFLSSDKRLEVLQLQLTTAPHHTPCAVPSLSRVTEDESTCDDAPTSLSLR